jgi:molecular chaperone GrpE
MVTEADSNPNSQAGAGKDDVPGRETPANGAQQPPSMGKDGKEMPSWYIEAEEGEQDEISRPNPAVNEEGVPVDDLSSPGVAEDSEGPEETVEMEAEPAELEESAEDEVELWRKKAEENRVKWMRAMAEMENFRKRSRREIESSINFANANLLRELLEVLDDFERAHGAAGSSEEGSTEAYVEGIRLIYQRFVDVLRRCGLERIPAKGEFFDPNLHEAVSQIETDEVESGQVAHVVQEGYRLKDMVLRPAKVVVAK